MKSSIILLALLLIKPLFAGVYSGTISDLDTNVSTNINNSFSNGVAAVKVNFDNNDSTTIGLSKAGETTYKDVNLSSPSSVKNIIKHFSEMSAGRASGIIKNAIRKDSDLKINVSNRNQLSIDNVTAIYHNQKRINQIQKTKDALTTLLNTFGGKNTIMCYIKRKLVPSFFCPLEGKNNSYFTGGVANTSQKNAKSKCDSYCQTKQNCLSKNIANFSSVFTKNIAKSAPFSISMPVSDLQKLKSIEFYIHGIDGEHVNIWVEGRLDGKVINFVNKMDIALSQAAQKITISVNIKGLSEIKLSATTPYSFYISKKNITIDSSGNGAIFDKVLLQYADDKYWFCSASQIVKKREDCPSGIIKNEIIGGSPVLLCVTDTDLQRGNEFGGYYDKESCESQCFQKKECAPTYRNLGASLSASMFNVDYGCLSGSNNDSCTKSLCKEKIFGNLMPSREVVYYNDSVKETTVINGQPVKGKIRPKYDIAEEMTSNDDPEAKKKLLNTMKKDNAYRSMISNRSYVISGKELKDSYPLETRATKIGSNGVSIEYVPNSNLFGTNKTAYIYVITKNFYIYQAKSIDNTFAAGATSNQEFKSASYTLVDSNGEPKMFLLKDKVQIFDGATQNWNPYMKPKNIVKMVGSDGSLSSYDRSQLAPATMEKVLTYKKYRFHYLLSNAYLQKLNNSDGVYLKRQVASRGYVEKKYSGNTDKTGGTVVDYEVMMITSPSKLSYGDIINKINNNTLKTVFRNSSSNDFSSPIPGHGDEKFNNENIKIFLLGTKNDLTTVGEFVPAFGEEGKDAYIFNFLYKQK